jgi:hypothetical protein
MPATREQALCPHCGAKVGRTWRTCWLCGLELPTDLPALAEPARDASAAKPPAHLGALAIIMRVVGGLLLGLVALSMMGLVLNGEVGAAIGWLVLMAPAGIITLASSLRKRSQGIDLSAVDKIGTFLASFAATIGIIVALGFAAFAALLAICLASPGGMNFH